MKNINKLLALLAVTAALLTGCATGSSTSQSAAPTVSGYIDFSASKQIK